MSEPVSLIRRDDVGLIILDSPPVNALGRALRAGLVACLEAARADPEIAVVVVAGKGRGFSGGADITEFDGPPRAPLLADVVAAFESCPRPTAAVIGGFALGGGLELALGMRYRVGLAGAHLALPEVNLGLLPGGGGTQRLPRLIGAEAALDVITSGRHVPVEEARDLGLVDAVAEDLDAAIVRVRELTAEESRPADWAHTAVMAPETAFEACEKRMKRRRRGFPAPLKCIDAIRAATRLPLEAGLAWEREAFAELKASPESKAQRYVFFAEREAAKVKGVGRDTPTREVVRAGVVGAGTMGAGIAVCLADAGIAVTVVESDGDALARGLARIAGLYDAALAKGRLDAAERDRRLARISGAVQVAELAAADLVIEAVFESMAAKRAVFERLDRVCKPGAILATNTSTLDVDALAAATGRPGDVVGMHFFSPANVMRLLEVVRGARTDDEVLATVMKLAPRIGKLAVCVGVCDGFVGNRMFIDQNREAQTLIEEGALPRQVDRALTDWGMAMGPFAVMDLAGTDVGLRIRRAREGRRDKRQPYPFTVADRLALAGRHGQKAGKGWYRYEPGSRAPIEDPDVTAMIEAVSREKGIERRGIEAEEIRKRCLWQLVNTGARLLEEGVAQRAGDIDMIFLNGYGFPAYRGGPMYHADRLGLGTVLADIESFQARHGERWRPAPLLRDLARSGRGFADV